MFWSDPPSGAQFLVSRKERQQRLFQAVCSRCQQLNQVDEMLSLGLKAKWPSLHFLLSAAIDLKERATKFPYYCAIVRRKGLEGSYRNLKITGLFSS
jgi:hypothetical protein